MLDTDHGKLAVQVFDRDLWWSSHFVGRCVRRQKSGCLLKVRCRIVGNGRTLLAYIGESSVILTSGTI